MTTTILPNVERDYRDYLRDESRLIGGADSISFPESELDVRETLKLMSDRGTPVTVQGARTGIAGGAVPRGGHILNLCKMNRVTGLRRNTARNVFFLTVQPGIALSDLSRLIASKDFDTSGWTAESLASLADLRSDTSRFFPPDPTERSAMIGGMLASNASGATTFHYGPTRRYVENVRIVLMDGALLKLHRGMEKTDGRAFQAETSNGRVVRGSIPSYCVPPVKTAAGYYAMDDMDLLDLFIGSEGTLGVFTEIELRLADTPSARWGMTVFFPSENNALDFVVAVRSRARNALNDKTIATTAAIEFFDFHSLELLREQKKENPAFASLPDIADGSHTAIYVEYHGGSEDMMGEAIEAVRETITACGGSEESAWIASNEREMERLKAFRHAVPEAVNLLIDRRRKTDPAITKLGTDMAVPDEHLPDVMRMYHRGLGDAGLQFVMFGHIGNNHVHVNILPNSRREYDLGKELYLDWSRQVVAMGGTVSAEHGIGKLKTNMLREMYGEKGIEEMRAARKAFDPELLLNRGNLFT